MSPANERPRSFKVTSGSCSSRFHSLALLTALLAAKKGDSHVFGPTEENLRKLCGLKDDDFDMALRDLLNVDKCITHRYSQEGTAGPCAHRYQFIGDVEITVDFVAPAEKK